ALSILRIHGLGILTPYISDFSGAGSSLESGEACCVWLWSRLSDGSSYPLHIFQRTRVLWLEFYESELTVLVPQYRPNASAAQLVILGCYKFWYQSSSFLVSLRNGTAMLQSII
ncbi:hypothetical protein PIB30_044769, partial [Stylosanthes scabra]|nr:hypothetical protein [Stylosanthes scabra]